MIIRINQVKNRLFVLLSLLVLGGETFAQVTETTAIPSRKVVDGFDNTTFCVAVLSDEKMYALRNVAITDIEGIDKISFNPTGSSIAVMRGKKNISIYSFYKKNTKMFELEDKRKGLKKRENLPFVLPGKKGEELMKDASKGDIIPLAMCYAPDARHFVASNSLGEIIIYDTKEYLPQAYIQSETPATLLAVSSNNYFIAAGAQKKLDIWNFQTKALRKSLEITDDVKGFDFSDDASYFAVVTGNKLVIYDTKTWEEANVFDQLGGVLSAPSFHPENKYVSVVKDNNAIVVVNLKNGKVEQTIEENAGHVIRSRFLINRSTHDILMLSNRQNALVFWNANGLNPYYGKKLSEDVVMRLNEWAKMKDGESMEEYAIRVNDETRAKQQQLFAQEVATELAGDRLALENPFVDSYDTESGMLSIGFNSMPSISLEVPENEVGNLKDGKNLKFENAIYVLNDKDEFELAYVEVHDEITDKVYIYDNIGRLKMLAMQEDDYVPLEVIQQINQEEIQLKEIKEQVVAENKEEQLISDNTQIDVKTEVIPGVDANGNKILNYKVGYQYEVINKAFSANEDFPSGGYNIEKSNAAMSLMKIIKSAFEGDFSKYLAEGKQVKIIITGSADASPIRGRIGYNGQYGEYVDEPYYKNGNLDNITVTKASGITSNEQLALMRAAGVKDYVEKNVSTLVDIRKEYEYHVEVAKEKGGEYRKINVEFIIMDAFPVK